ncbi:MAG: MFS transporter [Candidatus Dormiibacterota bacterium]
MASRVRDRTGLVPALLLCAGLVPVAMNLRTAVTGIPPVLPDLAARYHLTPTTQSVLVALPTICFGVFSFAASPLRARFGEERAIFGSVIVFAVGIGARALDPATLLFPGTIVAGAGIGLLNVLLTSLVRRRAPRHVGPMLSLYTLSLQVGSTVAAGVSVPIYLATGSFTPTLGIWTLLAVIALVLWLPQLASRPPRTSLTEGSLASAQVARNPLAWLVACFMGLQSLMYFSALSWLPTLLRSRGMPALEAGILLSAFNICGLAASTVAPLLGRTVTGQRVVVVTSFSLGAIGFTGLVLAPIAIAPVWVVCIGFGQGALLPTALLFMIVRSPDGPTASGLSGMAQGVGYLLAAAGSFTIGQAYAVSGTWVVPMVIFVVMCGLGLACGLGAARDIVLPSVAPPEPAES